MIELLLQAERALSVGLLDRAETLYRQVARADPRNSIAVVGLARVTLDRGDDEGALELARRALAIDSENVAAQRMVARLEEVIDYRVNVDEALGLAGPEAAGAEAEPEPEVEPEAAVAPEAEVEPEAAVAPEPGHEPEPVVDAEAPVEPELVVEPEAVVEPEPEAEVPSEAEVAPEREPELASEPELAPEAIVEPEWPAPMSAVLGSAPEPEVEPEPVVEPPAPEPTSAVLGAAPEAPPFPSTEPGEPEVAPDASGRQRSFLNRLLRRG